MSLTSNDFLLNNSEDPDETPHHVASHLGLRSLTANGTLGLSGLRKSEINFERISVCNVIEKMMEHGIYTLSTMLLAGPEVFASTRLQ